jgi:hypothetical protein
MMAKKRILVWRRNQKLELLNLGVRMDCGDSGAVYLTHEQAADLADQLKSMLEADGEDL